MAKIKEKNTFTLEEVKKLHFEIDCADMIVNEAEGVTEITVEAEYDETEKYSCKNDAGKLKVVYRLKKKNRISDDTDCIVVTIPAGASFEKIKLELGAGRTDINCKEANFQKAKFEIGAGKLNVHTLKNQGTLEISVGAGDVKMDHVEATDTNIECGVGRFALNGTVNGNLKVDCGIGRCELLLDADEKGYNYEVSSGLGKVTINGNRCGGLGSKYSVRNQNAIGSIELSCGVGSIELTTQKRIAE